jgi:hypothetical protein
MMAKKAARKELPIPPQAKADEGSVEMIRVWIASGKLHCALHIGLWERMPEIDEDMMWGRMLADILQLVARAIQERRAVGRAETVARVLRALENELDEPTRPHRGRFVK